MTQNKRLKIGITVAVPEDMYQAVWSSGIFQNILLLYQLFKGTHELSDVYLLDQNRSPDSAKSVQLLDYTYEVMDGLNAGSVLDVVIEMGTVVFEGIAKKIQERGGKVVSLRCGNAMIDTIMGVFSSGPPIVPYLSTRYDQIWVLPHYGRNSGPMLQTLHHCPMQVAPYIWEPVFLKNYIKLCNFTNPYGYQVGKTSRNVAICEPTLNPTKTFHFPVLVCEEAWRQRGDLPLNHAYVIGGYKIAGNQSLVAFINYLEMFKAGKITFEARVDIVNLMSNIADIVVSHHWENGLNNLYFDVLYGNYPLIHNSSFFKDFGYYYPDFNPQEGGRQLLQAIAEHDQYLPQYTAQNQNLFAQYSIRNPDNISTYVRMIQSL